MASVDVDPGALEVAVSLTATQYTNVNVDAGALSVATTMTGTFLFIDNSEVYISVYSGNQLKMIKTIQTSPELSGDVTRRNKTFVNVQGDHLTLKIESGKSGKNMYLTDLHVVIAIVGGR